MPESALRFDGVVKPLHFEELSEPGTYLVRTAPSAAVMVPKDVLGAEALRDRFVAFVGRHLPKG